MTARSRQRVHDYVVGHPEATAAQVARGLGMRAPAVRHHLAILLADGRIERAMLPMAVGPGRPAVRYRISARMAGDNLAMLADALLMAQRSEFKGGRSRSLLDDLANHLIQHIGLTDPRAGAGGRLLMLVAALNRMHYQAHWEAGAEGPRVIFGQCPYAGVIENHPELCQMDARAISQVMRRPAKQLSKINVRSRSPARCVFSLGEGKTALQRGP